MIEHQHYHEEPGHCQSLLTSLGEYVDGELSADLCSALERHLMGCSRCRIVVDTLRKTVDLYHETSGEACLPDDVRSRLYLRLELDDFLK